MNSGNIYNEVEAWITYRVMEANKSGETLLSLARESNEYICWQGKVKFRHMMTTD